MLRQAGGEAVSNNGKVVSIGEHRRATATVDQLDQAHKAFKEAIELALCNCSDCRAERWRIACREMAARAVRDYRRKKRLESWLISLLVSAGLGMLVWAILVTR